MTITVHPGIVEGTSISQSASGFSATRTFLAEATAQETMVQVLTHSEIPQYAEIHPDFDGIGIVPIYAFERTCSPVDADNAIFRVTVNYSYPDFTNAEPSEDEDAAIVQIGSSVTTSKTELDKDGNQIIVTLTGQPNQTGSVDIQVPQTTIGFRRREPSNPGAKSIANTGCVNSAALGGGVYAVGTLLCTVLDGESPDGGLSYDVVYSFQYDPATWIKPVVYIDPETDRPHEDVDIAMNEGVAYPEVFPEANFASLNLPWPT